MKHYKSYMDRVTVPEELHEKLLDLEEPKKASHRPAWQRYGALAACAALLVGAGVYQISRLDWHNEIVSPLAGTDRSPVPSAAPSVPAIWETTDIALVEGDDIEPGMKTIPGYEVRENRAGMDVAVYHVLPWIDYGSESNGTAASLDWDIPQGAARRDLSTQEIIALLGGAEAVDLHLDWSAYELTGWAAWYDGDGPFWGAYLHGYKGPMDHFEFAVTAGQMPPTCIAFGGSVEQEVWGMTVTADKYDGENGCDRRVSFMKDNYGYRFDLTSTDGAEAAERLVSRAVTWVANGDGLNFSIALPHGVIFPAQDPGLPAGEPNWNDNGAAPAPSRSADTNGEASPSRGPAAP